jgi:hypothetical protein
MREEVIQGHKAVGGKAEGRALVSKDAICWLKTLNLKGEVVEKGNNLYGESVADSIFVYPTGKGSTSGSYKLYQLALEGHAPKAIVNVKADSVTLSGAILSKIPMVHKFDVDPTQVINTGDRVMVDGDAGTVTITRS